MLERIAIQLIERGEGVFFIDPHGDSAEKIIDSIPKERTRDVIYFDPSDREYAIGINILDCKNKEERTVVVDEVVRMFRHIYGNSWGVRLQQILYNTVAALLEYGNQSILGIERMLSDDRFREKILARVHDPVIKSYWIDQYGQYDKRFRAEATASVQNKVGQFVADKRMRRIVGQVQSTFDVKTAMREKQIVIANLAKGDIGGEQSKLLGSLLVTKLLVGAMQRPKAERKQAYTLVVDEFHNFGTETFQELVAEARKYGLGLIAAHQYLEQIEDERTRKAMLGNAGTLIAFRVGVRDADILARELEISPEYLMDMEPFRIRVRTVGMLAAQTAKTTPWEPLITGRKEFVKNESRRHWARRVGELDKKLASFYAGATRT